MPCDTFLDSTRRIGWWRLLTVRFALLHTQARHFYGGAPPRSRIILMVAIVILACRTIPNDHSLPAAADHDVLTRAELAKVGGTTLNAYSAVERLRPAFLVIRPGSGTLRGTSARLYVFINGNLAGDVDVLKTMPLASVESIRRVQATTAFTQFGEMQSGDGIILVRLRR